MPGKIEYIKPNDPMGEMKVPLATENKKHGKAIIFTTMSKEIAGVDWIRTPERYPVPKGIFVTPPFAGYVSGHSTFQSHHSRNIDLCNREVHIFS